MASRGMALRWASGVRQVEISEGKIYARQMERALPLLRAPIRGELSFHMEGPSFGVIDIGREGLKGASFLVTPSVCRISEELLLPYRGRPFGKVIRGPRETAQDVICYPLERVEAWRSPR